MSKERREIHRDFSNAEGTQHRAAKKDISLVLRADDLAEDPAILSLFLVAASCRRERAELLLMCVVLMLLSFAL